VSVVGASANIHMPCAYCGIPTRHTNDKYGVVCDLEGRVNFLTMQLGRLVGLKTLEEMADEKTLFSAVERWKKKNN